MWEQLPVEMCGHCGAGRGFRLSLGECDGDAACSLPAHHLAFGMAAFHLSVHPAPVQLGLSTGGQLFPCTSQAGEDAV